MIKAAAFALRIFYHAFLLIHSLIVHYRILWKNHTNERKYFDTIGLPNFPMRRKISHLSPKRIFSSPSQSFQILRRGFNSNIISYHFFYTNIYKKTNLGIKSLLIKRRVINYLLHNNYLQVCIN